MRNNLSQHGLSRVLFSGLAVAALALWFRHGLLEAGALPRDCTLADAPLMACTFKTALVQIFIDQRIGWVSLLAAGLALVPGWRGLAWAGWLCGVAGLVLYSYDPAAVGALLALLVLVGANEQDRERQGKADQQPADRLRVGRLA